VVDYTSSFERCAEDGAGSHGHADESVAKRHFELGSVYRQTCFSLKIEIEVSDGVGLVERKKKLEVNESSRSKRVMVMMCKGTTLLWNLT
jgi:hypothetical protein